MKNPEYSLMEFLINYSSILKTSGNFMYNTINNRIEGAKISLNTGDGYADNWSPETYLLNSVFKQIDLEGVKHGGIIFFYPIQTRKRIQ